VVVGVGRCGRIGLMVDGSLEVLPSALKHGVEPESIEQVVCEPLVSRRIGDNQAKSLLVGFGLDGELLEVVVVFRDDGTAIAIHAMRCRKTYRTLLEGARP
jgi:hypothetical protein